MHHQQQQPLVAFLTDRAELAFRSVAPDRAPLLAEQFVDQVRAAIGGTEVYISGPNYAKRNQSIRARYAELRKENPSKTINQLAIALAAEVGLARNTVRDIVSGRSKH